MLKEGERPFKKHAPEVARVEPGSFLYPDRFPCLCQTGRKGERSQEDRTAVLRRRWVSSLPTIPAHPPSRDPWDEQDTTVIGGLPAGIHSQYLSGICLAVLSKATVQQVMPAGEGVSMSHLAGRSSTTAG